MNSKLARYIELLRSWPGLVSRGVDPATLALDCLVLLGLLGDARTLLDVGSGGGMPGIPLQIGSPDLRVTLLEADRAKAAFLVHAAAALELELAVVAERAETAGQGPLRETFDVAVCRALAPAPVLHELCLPFVRVGGRLLAMSSAGLEPGEAAAALLGGGEMTSHAAPSPARAHGVVLEVVKSAPTPAAYPRRPGVPGRRPLGG